MDKETSEIVKLTERISKDPKSKLFVPLAEEYKKAGDIEMAIYVLTEGLKNNPGYVTARSILGRLLFDMGDLTGSQKELEEVVKAIPDNLLAQRKLGDICVLQDKPNDAIGHYKSLLSLNPRDHEIASMIADIEAGRDVRPRIPQPKSKQIPTGQAKEVKQEEKQQQQEKQQPPISPAPRPLVTAQDAHGSPPENAKAATISDIASTPTPLAAVKNEEPEEVVVVEPLETESPELESTAGSFDLLLEQAQGDIQTSPADAPAEMSFASTELVREEQSMGDQLLAEPAILKKETPEETQPVAAEKPIKAEIAETEIKEEAPSVLPVNVPEEAPEKSDDFTTDTLAELYIAQGFYEKAIDIYERMLVDKPNSLGLIDKLDRVKAMAAASVADASLYEEKSSADIFAEPQVYRAKKEPSEEKKEADLYSESREQTPAPAGIVEGTDKFVPSPAQEFTGTKPFYTDFEPREYIPPKEEPVETKAEPIKTKAEPVKMKAEPAEMKAEPIKTKAEPAEMNVEPVEAIAEKTHGSSKSPKASRRETIDRLETWLRNIKKEK